MLLNAKEISKYLHGALTYKPTEGGLIPYRFSRSFRDYVDDFEAYAASAAGICLSFSTDASVVTLEYATIQICDQPVPAVFDICINGVLRCHIPALSAAPQKVSFELKMPSEVEIWFPYQAEIEIRSLDLQNVSFCNKIKETRKKCLFLGDSITQGFNCEYPSLTICATLSRSMDVEFFNQGIGGYSHRKSFVQEQGFSPDVILIALGTNDPSWPQAEKRDVYGFYEKLNALYPDVPTAIITPYKRYLEYDRDKMDEIVSQIRECASKRNHTILIDGREVSAHIPSFYADGLHPNTMGTQFIAAHLMNELKALEY